MYLLSDRKPKRKTKREKITMGNVNINSSFETVNRTPSATKIRIENICVLFTLVFKILEIGFSTGNKNNKRMRNNIKVKAMLNLFSANI